MALPVTLNSLLAESAADHGFSGDLLFIIIFLLILLVALFWWLKRQA